MNRREELTIKVVLDTSEAEAKVAELEARVNALASKLSGGSGSGMASGFGGGSGMGAPAAGMGFGGTGMGYGPMGIPAGALPSNAGGAGLPFVGMALTAGLGAAAGQQLAANAQRGAMALGAATPSPFFSTLPAFWGAAPTMQDRIDQAGLGDMYRRVGGFPSGASEGHIKHPSVPSAGPGTRFLDDVDTAARFGAAQGMGLIGDDAQLNLPFEDLPGGPAGPAGPGGPNRPGGSRFPAFSGGYGRARQWARSPAGQRILTGGFQLAGTAAGIGANWALDTYQEDTSAAVRAIQTGRAAQPWDHARADWTAGGALYGFTVGALAGSVIPGVGTIAGGIAGAIAGGMGGHAIGDRQVQMGEALRDKTAAAMNYAASTGLAGSHTFGGGYMNAVATLNARTALGVGLLGGQGEDGRSMANRIAAMAYNASGKNEALAQKWTNDIAGGVDSFTSPFVTSTFSRETAMALLQKNTAAGVAYLNTFGHGYESPALLQTVGDADRAGVRVQRFATMAGAAEANVRGVQARGGDASQVAGAIGQEVSAVQRAASATQEYIKSLERVGSLTEEQKLQLEQARTALAGFNSQISELRYTAVRVRSDEQLDIAGTRSAVSGARLPERLAGARRGDATIFDAALMDLAGEADTIANELKRPGLKPEDRRRLKRQQAQTQAALFGMEREAADYYGSESSRFADLTAQGASLWGRLTAMNNGDPAAIAQINRNVSWRQGEAMYASSSYLNWMRQNPRFYSDEQVRAQENVVLANKLAYAESAVTAGAAPFTAGMANTLEGLDLETRRAMRDGGSLSALGVAGRQRGFWNGRIGAINRTADEQIRITPQFRTAINDRRNRDLLGASNALFALDDLEGVYSPSPELSMAYENARSEYAILQNDVFRPGNRREASMARMAPVQTMIEQVRRQMETASPANRARLTRTLNALRVEESEIGRSETEGWLGRVLEYESNRPSHAALFSPTHKDLIRFNPSAGRTFGAGDRESAERMRDRRVYGQSDATNRPGDSGAQALRVVLEPLTINIRQPDGTTQRQTVTPQVRQAAQSDPRQRAMAERAR